MILYLGLLTLLAFSPSSRAALTAPSNEELAENIVSKTFSLTRSDTSAEVTVTVATSGTATEGSDYTITPSSRTYLATESSQDFVIDVTDDSFDEESETIILTFTEPDSGDTATVTYTIQISDRMGYTLTSSTALAEDAGAVTVDFTCTLSTDLATVTFDIVPQDSSATRAASDYAFTDTQVTCANGDALSVTITISDDDLPEVTETFALVWQSGTFSTYTEFSITDNDPIRITSSLSTSATEGQGSVTMTGTTFEFVNGAQNVNVGITMTVTAGTAFMPSDVSTSEDANFDRLIFTYNPTAEDLSTLNAFTINFPEDSNIEGVERFTVEFTSQYMLTGDTTIEISITDNDPETITLTGPPSVNEDGVTAVYTFTRGVNRDRAVTLNYNVVANDADPGVTADSGTLEFASGDETKTLTVFLIDDVTKEEPKTFTVSATGNLVSAITPITTTTVDDDGYTVTFSSGSATEGGNLVVTFTRDSSVDALDIKVATTDGTATSADYAAITGTTTVNFPDGSSTASISIAINDDPDYEASETFTVTVTSDQTLKADSTGSAVMTITDNDVEVLTLTGGGTVREDTGTVDFVLTRTQSFEALTVTAVTTGSGSNAATVTGGSADIVEVNQNFVLPINSASETISVTINNDGDIEYSEEFTLTVTATGGIATVSQTATITNDDAYTLTVVAPAVTEGTPVTVTIDRDSGTDSLSFDVVTAGDSATLTSDFADGSQTLTFNDGQTSISINIPTVDDSTYEPQESFTFSVTASDLVIPPGVNPTIIAINDNEDEPITISGPSTVDENDGTATYTFTRTHTDRTTSFSYNLDATPDGDPGVDALGDTMSFAPGESSKDITVTLLNDQLLKAPKSFAIVVTGATMVDINAPYPVSITDDDAYGVTFSDLQVVEGSNFDITFTRDSDYDVLVILVSTTDVTADSSDYTGVTGQAVTFTSGVFTATISIPTTGDSNHEPTETFTVSVTSAEPLKTTPVVQTMTITDNDVEVLTISGGGNVDEADGPVTITLTRTATFEALVVTATTSPSGSPSIQGGDITSLSSQQVTFPVSSPSVTFTVAITDDGVVEFDEEFTVTVDGSNGIASVSTTVTIVNDDPYLVTATVAGDVPEGSPIQLTFTRDSSVDALTITFSASDGTATGGAGGSFDYVTTTAVTITFNDGESEKTHDIATTDDSVHEGTETLLVSIAPSDKLTAATSNAVLSVNILDDDREVLTVTEGLSVTVNEDAGPLVLTVTRTSDTTAFTAQATTAPTGTYQASPDDYTGLTAENIVFNINDLSTTLSIAITNNDIAEPNEQFTVTIVGSDVDTVVVTVTIVNDDPDIVTIEQFLAATEDAGGVDVVVKRTLDDQEVDVKVNTADVSALGGTDYDTLSDFVVTFLVGSREATFTVNIREDISDEDDEIFTIQVSGGTVVTSDAYEFIIADNEGSRAWDCRRNGQDCPAATDVCHPEVPFCECKGGADREGKMCNIQTDLKSGAACAGVTCNDHGECQDNGGVASCACYQGYYGAQCDKYFLEAICTATDMTVVANPHGTFDGLIYVIDKIGESACTANPLPGTPSDVDGIEDDNTQGYYLVVPHSSAACGPISPVEGPVKTYYERFIFIQYAQSTTSGFDQKVTVQCAFDRDNLVSTIGLIQVDPSGPFIQESAIGDFDPLTFAFDINDVPVAPGSSIALSRRLCFTVAVDPPFGGLEVLDILFHNNKAGADSLQWLAFTNSCPVQDSNTILFSPPRYSQQASKREVEFCFFVFKFINSEELLVNTTVRVCVNEADCDQTPCGTTRRRKRQTNSDSEQTIGTTFNVQDPDTTTVTSQQTGTNRTVVSTPVSCSMPLEFLPTVVCMGFLILILILVCLFLTYRLSRRRSSKQKEVDEPPRHPVMYMR